MAQYVRDWAQMLNLAKSKGCKIVWTAHNLYPHEQLHHDLEHEARQILLAACDTVIVHCHTAVQLLQTQFNIQTPCAVIPHGHYCGIYGASVNQLQARQTLGLPLNGVLYLFFGQLRSYKGLEQLLQIFSSLPEDFGTLLIRRAL